jgi:hypothetical protein
VSFSYDLMCFLHDKNACLCKSAIPEDVCVYIYIYIYIYIYTYMYINSLCVCVCAYVCMYMYTLLLISFRITILETSICY